MKLEKELKEKDVCMSFNGKTVNSGTLDDCVGTIGKDEKELVYMKLKDLAVNCNFVDLPTPCENESARKNVDPPSVVCEDDTNAVVKNEMTLESSASLKEDPIITQVSPIYKYLSWRWQNGRGGRLGDGSKRVILGMF